VHPSIDDRVIDYYHGLFGRIFSEPFRSRIAERLKRNGVIRQIGESADAASQSLSRFLVNAQLTEEQVAVLLDRLAPLSGLLSLDDIGNPNVTPEAVVARVLPSLPVSTLGHPADHDPVFQVALHSVVQVLMLIGPVMAEWQKLSFSTAFELPRRVVNRLNQTSEQLGAFGPSGQAAAGALELSGQAAADERYELMYRDYLLQRFHRVEAGTVRMTTNLDVDLRELFVMPRVRVHPSSIRGDDAAGTKMSPMSLKEARKLFEAPDMPRQAAPTEAAQVTALEQVKWYPHNVIVGSPGSGKSTFLEWLQVKVAAAEEELVLAGRQAIPLLLRVRQLDARDLPHGAALIEKVTASRDRAALMPAGWIDRQMAAGRVLFMLDGLDEVDPELRDTHVIPWLAGMHQEFPRCHYLVSSRPVGYPPGAFPRMEAAECDLLDFDDDDVRHYARHWCTAVRLARNELEEEARREGTVDGDRIVDGFKGHLYIHNLARNPLMLSAICLVNYFEGGQLPKDRAVLYKLCVEGLLHHWDQRRGIHSEFTLDEKLRCCREVAIAMQAGDRAELEAASVSGILERVLGDSERATQLLEHIRYRTGLLLERRPDIFAFAHLTFQEYLAACAVHEGNQLGIDVQQLVREHADGRWNEVIALFCALAPVPVARCTIELLIAQPDSHVLGQVLEEAYLAANVELGKDLDFRRAVLERIALAPGEGYPARPLSRFPTEEVAPIANKAVGQGSHSIATTAAYQWLWLNPAYMDGPLISKGLHRWKDLNPYQITELNMLLHRFGSANEVEGISREGALFTSPGPSFEDVSYSSQAEIALLALADRFSSNAMEEGHEAPYFAQRLVHALHTYAPGGVPVASSARSYLYVLLSEAMQNAVPYLDAPSRSALDDWLRGAKESCLQSNITREGTPSEGRELMALVDAITHALRSRQKGTSSKTTRSLTQKRRGAKP